MLTLRLLLPLITALLLLCTPSLAQRVVSLLPSATYSAAQMGADANVVGRTSYCPKAEDGTKTAIVGDAMTVSVEAIAALKPDVVIASPFTSAAVVERLKTLGLKIVTLATPVDFEGVCSQFMEVGRLTGHTAQAAEIVARERRTVEGIAAKTKSLPARRFYVQIGANPTWGATPDYYINDMAALLGGVNILAVGEGGCSREAVVARRPEVIVVSSLGGLAEGEVAMWHRLTKAVTVTVDENALCCPTPVFFSQSLQTIADALLK